MPLDVCDDSMEILEQGYEDDALDKSREGLKIAREYAAKRAVADNCTWIQADVFEYAYPEAAYDVITIQSILGTGHPSVARRAGTHG